MRIYNDAMTVSSTFATTTYTDATTLEHMLGYSVRASYTVDAATAKTFAADTDVDATANTITLAAHGWQTARAVRASSTGTLPGGLATSTDYYVIVVDANTIKLATSAANATAGTAIDITNVGTAGATHTLTPNALAASWQLQASLDNTAWEDVGSATTISATGSALVSAVDVFYPWVRVKFIVTGGQLSSVTARINAKGA